MNASKKYFIILCMFLPISSLAQEKDSVFNSDDSFASRQQQEEKASSLRYSFVAHKPTYILPLTYSFHPNPDGNGTLGEVDKTEIKFQFSFKINLIDEFFDYIL